MTFQLWLSIEGLLFKRWNAKLLIVLFICVEFSEGAYAEVQDVRGWKAAVEPGVGDDPYQNVAEPMHGVEGPYANVEHAEKVAKHYLYLSLMSMWRR